MENPYQKFDEEQDRRYEKLIRQKIQNIIELAGNESDDTIRISLLQKIVDLYEDLRIQVLNYTNYDEKEKQGYLKEIDELLDKKYKALQKRREEDKKKERAKRQKSLKKKFKKGKVRHWEICKMVEMRKMIFIINYIKKL